MARRVPIPITEAPTLRFQLWVWGAFTVIWVVLLIPTLLWWKDSLVWIVVMSWWANVAASASAFLTIKSELEQRKRN